MARPDVIKISGTSAEQRQRWRRASGPSLSAWMRLAADRTASGKDGLVLSAEHAERLEAALVAIRADLNRGVGNNLNQIAVALNTSLKAGKGADPGPHEAALNQAAEDLHAIRDLISRALDSLAGMRP